MWQEQDAGVTMQVPNTPFSRPGAACLVEYFQVVGVVGDPDASLGGG